MTWDFKHFKSDSKIDKWGDASKIDLDLVLRLDRLRQFLGHPIYVTSGYRSKDMNWHGKGKALDITVPTWDDGLFELYLAAERFSFQGLGVYRDWFFQGRLCGGLHVDSRPLDGQAAARWLCVREGSEACKHPIDVIGIKQKYVGLNQDNLYEYGII